jgi:hypothetical protein
MSPDGGATIRADLNTVVEEALAAEKFFIGSQLLPAFGVDAKSGTYPKLTKTLSELMKADITKRAPGGSYGETTRQWTTDTYDTEDRGLEEAVDDTHQKDLGRYFNAEASAARFILRSMKMAEEIRIAAAIFNTTNFGAATNSAVAYTTANNATISVIADIQAAIERLNNKGEEANTIVMSGPVWNRIRGATLVKEFLVGQDIPAANVTPNALAQAFAPNGIKQVLLGRSAYDGAKKGQAFSSSAIWNNTYIWVGNVQGGDPMNGGAGRTFVWNAEGGLYVTESYRNEQRRSNMVRVRQHTIEKIVNGESGTLIATQYA